MKSIFKIKHFLSSTFAIALLTFNTTSQAQGIPFADKATFLTAANSCTSCTIAVEDFSGYSGTITMIPLSSTNITPASPYPTIFNGGWIHPCGNNFSGAGLIAEPRFASSSITLNFSPPVVAFGASVYDDHDGIPLVNTIGLVATTTTGNTITIEEDCSNYGEAGFLGALSTDGIAQVTFYIDGKDGNLELDEFIVVQPAGVSPKSTETATTFSTLNKEEQVQVYPNPSRKDITIQLDNPTKEEVTIEMYNNIGNKVWEHALDKQTLTWNKTLEMTKAGVYIIMFKIGEQVQYKKVIINNDH